jgi:ABC-type branched-subunit amino acid transport system ATPase component
MTSRLTLQGVHAGYGRTAILHGVDLLVPAGGALTIIGPNGSGKSTLLKTIAGLVAPSAGRVLFGEDDVTRRNAPARARAGMGYVPQEANVFRNLSVAENLRLGWEFLQPRGSGLAFSKRREEILALFPELQPFLQSYAGLLSGGQRQMVAMASAMMPRPKLLVLDEPSAGLSPKNAQALYDIVARIRSTGITLLLIEQNIALGLAAAQTGLLLVAGQVRLQAPAVELLAHDDLPRLYLGTA